MRPRENVLLCFLAFFTETLAQSATDPCPAGEERFLGQTPYVCQKCNEGYYKVGFNSNRCLPCGPGSFSYIGLNYCMWCEMGKFSPGTVAMGTLVNGLCQDCPAGKTTCGIASASCVTCSPCEAGKFSAAGTACGPCEPSIGDGKKPGETICSNCAAGKYSSAGQTTCASCPAGKAACATGMSACDNGCNVAGYTGPDASCSCSACAPGKFKQTSGTMGCTDCPAGKYRDAFAGNSSASCTNCPSNAPTSSAGSSSLAACQRLCPPGQTGALDGVAACTPCPAGTFKASSGSAACTLCPNGKYNLAGGRSVCSNCDAGGIMTSMIKPAGSYYSQGVWYSAAHVPFDFDKAYTTEGSTTSLDCVCANGYYRAAQGVWGGPCTACPAGKYRNTFSADWWLYRDRGCIDCPEMTISYEGWTSCERCDKYYYQRGNCGTGNTIESCILKKQCPVGYTGPDAYCDTCSACEAGKYKSVTGSAPCEQCSVGATSPAGSTAASACVCGPGLYKF